MKRTHAPKLIGTIGITGLMILLTFPAERIHSAIPTIKVPGPYPYETPVQVPAPTISESSVLPTPAPFTYRESSSSLSAPPDHASQIASARRPLTAKTVREAAFKYNGVPDFCEFLAALPADVSVFDPKLGRPRALVKGGRVVDKNAAWLRNRKQARLKGNDRTFVSVEELGMRNSGI
jgi:hypothetical protein